MNADVIPLPPRGADHDSAPEPSSPLDALAGVFDRAVAGPLSRTVDTIGGTIDGTIGRTIGAVTGHVRDTVAAAGRRLGADPSVDDWGRDPALVDVAMVAAHLRWDVSTGGAEQLPKRRGALIVVNAPQLALAPVFASFAIGRAVGRPVRFVGRSDTDPLGAVQRRLGGLLDLPEEVGGALRADELVLLGAAHRAGSRDVGTVDHAIVGAALAAGVKVFPAATSSTMFARHARVEIGRPSRPPRGRRGPLAELELADRLRDDIHALLDEMGDIPTGTPLDWFPFSGMGAH